MIKAGTKVKWKIGSTYNEGIVLEIFERSISIEISGSMVTRDGSEKNRALLVKEDSGDKAVILEMDVIAVEN